MSRELRRFIKMSPVDKWAYIKLELSYYWDEINFFFGFFPYMWRELHRTDLGDSEHYANGFRKFSAFEPVEQIAFIISVIFLIVSLISLIVTKST